MQSVYWDHFLYALAEGVRLNLHGEKIVTLMFTVGQQLSEFVEVDRSMTMAELERRLNDYLTLQGWGRLEICRIDTRLILRHYSPPFFTCFGASNAHWVNSILEGFYSEIFYKIGASQTLRLYCIDSLISSQEPIIQFSLEKTINLEDIYE
ncbi:MAG: hypothetical protein HRU20_30335 [Pseudomonadales bacterium]|nr:hypothetical protein [Pseudomonadales bacterium]